MTGTKLRKVYPSQKESAKIFSLAAEQGKKPQHESYSYVILPAITLDDIKLYHPSFSVIENNGAAQIIGSKNNDVFMFVIYNPANFSIANLGEISFKQLGLYLLERKGKGWSDTTADPTHKLSNISFTLNGKEYRYKSSSKR